MRFLQHAPPFYKYFTSICLLKSNLQSWKALKRWITEEYFLVKKFSLSGQKFEKINVEVRHTFVSNKIKRVKFGTKQQMPLKVETSMRSEHGSINEDHQRRYWTLGQTPRSTASYEIVYCILTISHEIWISGQTRIINQTSLNHVRAWWGRKVSLYI